MEYNTKTINRAMDKTIGINTPPHLGETRSVTEREILAKKPFALGRIETITWAGWSSRSMSMSNNKRIAKPHS
jgi:hypothetical protein